MKKKNLFIVTNNQSYERIVEYINQNINSGENFLISFDRNLLESIKKEKLLKKKNILDGNKIIENKIDFIGKKISFILKKLLSLNSDFYLSKFSELNNADNFYNDFLINDVSLSIIKSRNISHIFSDIRLSGISNKIHINYYKSQKKNLKIISLLKYFFISFKNLINEIFFSLTLNKDIVKKNKLIITNFKDNWMKKNSKYRYIYIQNFNQKPDYSYLVSCLRNNTNSHNSYFKYVKKINTLAKQNDIFFIEAWVSPLYIIKNYFIGYFLLIKNYFRYKNFFLDHNLKSYHSILCIFYLIDYPKNKNLELAMKNFFEAQKEIKKICIPVFELNDGKIACKVGNDFKINTYGVQHGYFNIWHKWRFYYNLKTCSDLSKNFLPKNIFFFGPNTFKWYIKTNHIFKKIIGNQRIKEYPKKYNFNKVNNNNILILLDLRDWHEKIFSLNDIFKKTKYNLIVKAHPFTISSVKKLMIEKKLIKNFILINDLKFFKRKYPKFVLSSDTGAIIELTKAGWPCFLLNNPTKPNISPILNYNNSLIRLDATRELVIKIEKFQAYQLKKYVRKQQYFSNLHLTEIGEKAGKKFQKYF